MECFDTEKFISLIKSKVSIWNHKSIEYSDKVKRNKDWAYVCEAIIPDFAEKSTDEKSAIEIELQGKWKVLRDGFMRSLRNQNKKNESAATSTKLYKYHAQLLFLKDLLEAKRKRKSSNVGTSRNQSKIPPVDIFIEKQRRDTKEISFDETFIETPNKNAIEKLNNDENDEDKLFLLCLLKDFKMIPDYYKLDAKSDIINVIKHYRNKNLNPYQNEGRRSSHGEYFKGYTNIPFKRTTETNFTRTQDSYDERFNEKRTTHRPYSRQSSDQSISSPEMPTESKNADIFSTT